MSKKSIIPFLLISVLIGILTFYLLSSAWLLVFLVLLLLLLFIGWQLWGYRMVILLLVCFFFSLIRSQATNQTILPIFLQREQPIQVTGKVVGKPVWYERSVYFYLQGESSTYWIKSTFQPEDLLLLEKKLANGNLLQCQGLTGISKSFFHTITSHQDYLKRKNASGFLITTTDNIRLIKLAKINWFALKVESYRNFFRKNLESSFPNNSFSSFLIAITLGPASGQSYYTEQYSQIGILHMMAISGANLMILALFFLFIFSLLSIKTPLKEILVLALLFFYLALINFLPGASRSYLMIVIILLATLLKKVYHPFIAICLSGIILLLWNPWFLFDVGFQLSFVGVMSFLLPVQLPSKGLIATFSSSLLVAYHFHILSFSSLAANLILVPFLPLFYLTGISCGMGVPVYTWYSFLMMKSWTLFGWLSLQFSLLPFSYRYIREFPIYLLVLYYLFLFGVLLVQFCQEPRKVNPYRKAILLVVMLPFMLLAFPTMVDNNMTVDFLDVGQGDSCLIQLPDGQNILIDGGKVGSGVLSFVKQRGINKIDLIILSHFHDDHYGGILEVIQQLPSVGRLIIPKTDSLDRQLFDEQYRKLTKKPFRVDEICGRKRIVLSTHCQIDFFSPSCDKEMLDRENENNRSLVCRLEYGGSSILFAGDIERVVEENLDSAWGESLSALILKLPHHGSHTSSTKQFLELVNPRIAIISSGPKILFNHPSDSVLERLHDLDIPYRITQESGTIHFFRNGKNSFQMNEENP